MISDKEAEKCFALNQHSDVVLLMQVKLVILLT
jgi:hypothetical protein